MSTAAESQTAERRVGMIGLGNMGGRMARRMVDHGFTLFGYDTRPGLAEAAGATPAASLAELVGAVDVVCMSLPDSHVIEPLVLGEAGVLAGARPGQVVVDLSSAAPGSTVRIHERLAEQDVVYIDAGISGGASGAEKGTLTIMAGGSPEVLEQISWVFEPIAAKVFWMGGSGAGHTTKLLNNFLNGVSLAATAEVMVAARKAGLDLTRVLEVINASSGVNYATLNRFPHIVKGDYLEGGLTGSLMTKDIALYVDRVSELGVPCLNAAGPLATFGLANNLGYSEQISNRVVDAIGDVSGGVRLYDGES